MATATTFFQQIATQAHHRFSGLLAYQSAIQIVPLDDHGGKRPAADFLPRLHQVPKTPDGLALVGAVYPSANVGIRGRREPGGILVIDIDEPGTLERIERDFGQLPFTYTTQTRPVSKPFKLHIYFLQTDYSCKTFSKQVTDVTRICGYDLKCNGGWGIVAAEGCVRDGETITALYDVPIVPIPDSLVDWIRDDIAKSRARKRAQPKSTRPSPTRTTSHPNVVPRDHRHWTIKSRVRTWRNTGMSDDEILPVLVNHIRHYFEDPEELLSKDGIRKLRATIHKTETLGSIAYARLLHGRRAPKPKPDPKSAATMRELFKSCPAEITSSDAHTFFSVQSDADEQRLIRQFHNHGYVAVGPQGSHHRRWIRPPAPSIPCIPSFPSLPSSLPQEHGSTQRRRRRARARYETGMTLRKGG